MAQKPMIPKRIIQTAKSPDLPPLSRASAVNLKLLHPDWDYCFYDDAAVLDFVSSEFPEYAGVFQAFPFKIQKFDFFRYLAVYRHGGFYFDLDVLLSEPLDSLLEHSCVLPFEELTLSRHLRETHAMDWEVGNYAFGAEPGDSFLGRVIENCVRSQREPKWIEPMMRGIPRWFRSDFEVLNSTGPGMLSRTLAESPELDERVTVLFPPDVHDKKHWHQFGAFGTHLMEGSWRDKGSLLRRKIAWKWEAWARRRGMEASRRLGSQRSLPVRKPAAGIT
jgi:hypothetical protein